MQHLDPKTERGFWVLNEDDIKRFEFWLGLEPSECKKVCPLCNDEKKCKALLPEIADKISCENIHPCELIHLKDLKKVAKEVIEYKS